MQIVSLGDTLHEMSKPFFSGKNKKKTEMLFVKSMLKIKKQQKQDAYFLMPPLTNLRLFTRCTW